MAVKRVSMDLDAELIKRVDAYARERGQSRTAVFAYALSQLLDLDFKQPMPGRPKKRKATPQEELEFRQIQEMLAEAGDPPWPSIEAWLAYIDSLEEL